ncbi:MAG: hypothetical protein RIB41_02915 [Oceanibaculum nanhaiense]|jgi:hypothetical protein|uniref:hypothetical protein n=1 Tax=Oceanibaculum nanhaiense TaxID=1909734 RepID=UPI0032ECDC6F
MNVGSAAGAQSLAITGMRPEQQQQVPAQGGAANLQTAGDSTRSGAQQGTQPAAPAESGRGTTLDISV